MQTSEPGGSLDTLDEAALRMLSAASRPLGEARPVVPAEPGPLSLRVKSQARWRLTGLDSELRPAEHVVSGRPCVRLVILCGPCLDRSGVERKLGVFGMDTHEQTDRHVWVLPFRVPGNGPRIGFSTAVPRVRGSGGSARVKLICAAKAGRGGKSGGGCKNTPDVTVTWITAQLEEIWAPGSTEVRKHTR